MANTYDGSLTFLTKIDMDGFKQGTEKITLSADKAVKGVENEFKSMGAAAKQSVSKTAADLNSFTNALASAFQLQGDSVEKAFEKAQKVASINMDIIGRQIDGIMNNPDLTSSSKMAMLGDVFKNAITEFQNSEITRIDLFEKVADKGNAVNEVYRKYSLNLDAASVAAKNYNQAIKNGEDTARQAAIVQEKAAKQAAVAQQKAAKQAEQSAERMSRSVKGLIKNYLLIPATAYFSVQGLTQLFSAAWTEAANAEREVKLLDATIKSTGNSAGKTKDQLLEMGASIQQSTNIASGMATNAISRLLEFTSIVPENFETAFKLSADYAERYMNGDMVGAAETLGRALEDPISGMAMLQKQGFKLTAEQKRQVDGFMAVGDAAKAQTIVLDMVSGSIAGTAASVADVGKQLQNSFNSALAEMGKELRSSINPGLMDMKTILEEAKPLFEFIGSLAGGILSVPLGIFNLAAGGYTKTFNALGGAVNKLSKANKLYKDGVISLSQYLTASSDDIEQYSENTTENLEKRAKQLSESIELTKADINKLYDAMKASPQGYRIYNEGLMNSGEKLKELRKELERVQAALIGTKEVASEPIKEKKVLSAFEKAKAAALTDTQIETWEIKLKLNDDSVSKTELEYKKSMRTAIDKGESFWTDNAANITAIYKKQLEGLTAKQDEEYAKSLQSYLSMEKDLVAESSDDEIERINLKFQKQIEGLKEYEEKGIDVSNSIAAIEKANAAAVAEFKKKKESEVWEHEKEKQKERQEIYDETARLLMGDTAFNIMQINLEYDAKKRRIENNITDVEIANEALVALEKEKNQKIADEQDKAAKKTKDFNTVFNDILKDGIQQGVNSLAGAFGGLFEQIYAGENAWKAMGNAGVQVLGGLLSSVGQTLLAQAAANEIMAALDIDDAITAGSKGAIAMAAGFAAIAAGEALKAIKFADGGIVPNMPGGKSGDKILARLNSGELVMNNQQQARTLMAISNGALTKPPNGESGLKINIINNAGADVSTGYNEDSGMLDVYIERKVLNTMSSRKGKPLV